MTGRQNPNHAEEGWSAEGVGWRGVGWILSVGVGFVALLLLWVSLAVGDSSSWLVTGIVGGATGIFAVLLVGSLVALFRGGGVGGRLYETTLRSEGSGEQGRDLLGKTVADLCERNPKYEVKDRSPESAEISVPVNLLSWGERITLSRANGGEGSIKARSKCAFPLQVADWGKNRQNIEQVRRSFERVARSGE